MPARPPVTAHVQKARGIIGIKVEADGLPKPRYWEDSLSEQHTVLPSKEASSLSSGESLRTLRQKVPAVSVKASHLIQPSGVQRSFRLSTLDWLAGALLKHSNVNGSPSC